MPPQQSQQPLLEEERRMIEQEVNLQTSKERALGSPKVTDVSDEINAERDDAGILITD